jgi:hypothetical protein
MLTPSKKYTKVSGVQAEQNGGWRLVCCWFLLCVVCFVLLVLLPTSLS